MKVLLASIPLTGHFNPVLAAAVILQKSGCETAIYTSIMFREKVEQAGIRFIPLPVDADEGARGFLGAFLRKHKGAPSNEDLVRAFVGFFVAPMTSQYRGLQLALQEFPADVVIHETCFTGVLPMLLGPRSERPASVHLGVIPLRLERADGAPWGPGVAAQRRQEDTNAICRGRAPSIRIESTSVTTSSQQLVDSNGLATVANLALPIRRRTRRPHASTMHP